MLCLGWLALTSQVRRVNLMPIAHIVDTKRRRLIFSVSGTITTEEMLTAADNAVHSLGPGTHKVLSDHRTLTTPATTPQLEALVAHLSKYRQHFGGTRWAIVVSQLASFGMMRMLGVLAERIPIHVAVFADPVDAERWLESGNADAMT